MGVELVTGRNMSVGLVRRGGERRGLDALGVFAHIGMCFYHWGLWWLLYIVGQSLGREPGTCTQLVRSYMSCVFASKTT